MAGVVVAEEKRGREKGIKTRREESLFWGGRGEGRPPIERSRVRDLPPASPASGRRQSKARQAERGPERAKASAGSIFSSRAGSG